MTGPSLSSDVMRLLHDIEQRSQRVDDRLSHHNERQATWTAVNFQVAKNTYLTPLKQIQEIFPLPEQITLIPFAKPWVYGVINLRGDLLPLFDLNYFLYGKATKIRKQSKILVINYQNLYSGVVVDAVIGLKHFQSTPDTKTVNQDVRISTYLNGNITQNDKSWDIFSFHKLTTDQRFLNIAE